MFRICARVGRVLDVQVGRYTCFGDNVAVDAGFRWLLSLSVIGPTLLLLDLAFENWTIITGRWMGRINL